MTAKTERFELRATAEEMARIRAAVELGHERSITEFLLDSALVAAEMRLMDRTQFTLSAKEYNNFLEVLDRPVQEKPRLRRLLNEPSILESQDNELGIAG
jgi:uncharacterized protein (DUF1778 family)